MKKTGSEEEENPEEGEGSDNKEQEDKNETMDKNVSDKGECSGIKQVFYYLIS